MAVSLLLPTGQSSLTLKGEISPRTMARIETIGLLDETWRETIATGGKDGLLAAAKAYQAAGMNYVAAKLRRRAGVKESSGRWTNVVPKDVLDLAFVIIQARDGCIRPDEVAGELGISRSACDKVTKRLRLAGKIRLVHKRFYEIVESEQEEQ